MTTHAIRGVLAAVLAALLTGCGIAAAAPLPEQVCGTTDLSPVRVPDEQCNTGNTEVRWYQADDDCLDPDDRTDVGQPLDDDYIEGEAACADERRVVVGVPLPHTRIKARSPAAKKPASAGRTGTRHG